MSSSLKSAASAADGSPQPHALPWLEARAHGRVTRYRRAGSGPVVVLVSRDDRPDAPLWPELGALLAGCCRLVTPEVPGAGTDLTAWLAEFLEALGATDVALVAADGVCLPALELALRDAEPIARLVLVPDGTGGRDDVALDGALDSSAHRSAVPLLVVRRGRPAGEVLPLIAAFVRGPDGGAPRGG